MRRWLIFVALLLAASPASGQISSRTTRFSQLRDGWSTAIERPDLRATFPTGSVVYNGKLWGAGSNDNLIGVLSFDGTNVRVGGKVYPAVHSQNKLWTDGTRLYAIGSGTKVTITLDAAPGNFQNGETITQTGSGATGWYLRTSGNTIVLAKNNATAFDLVTGDITVTGGSSGVSGTPTNVATAASQQILNRSADGYTDFVPCLDTASALSRCLVDCGDVGALGRVLLWIPYGATQIMYCLPESAPPLNLNWYPLINTPAASSIDHFHGGAKIGTQLFVFTGDAGGSYRSSLLHLALSDLEDVITGANGKSITWLTSAWGLDVTGTTRRDYLRTGAGAPYCVGCDYEYRLVDLVPNDAGTEAVWLSDDTTAAGRWTNIVNLSTFATRKIGYNQVKGPGTYLTKLADGRILAICISEWSGSAYYRDGDRYTRIYQLSDDWSEWIEVWRVERRDYAAPSGTFSLNEITEFPPASGIIWVEKASSVGTSPFALPLVLQMGSVRGRFGSTLNGFSGRYTLGPNQIANGRFQPDASVWVAAGPGLEDGKWLGTRCTLSRETGVVDTESGATTAMKMEPTLVAGSSQATYKFSAAQARAMSGNPVTLRFKIKTAAPAVGYIAFRSAAATANSHYVYLSSSTDWQDVSIETFFPIGSLDVDNTVLVIQCRSSGADQTPWYASDARCVIGAWAGKVPPNWSRDIPRILPEGPPRQFAAWELGYALCP